jgi:anaerobic magnesium-protoporphyrin IX monomethyl ester cyclase
MSDNFRIIVLNLPSPPYRDVCREYAGGFGIAWSRPNRPDYGQSDPPILQPCLPFIASALSKKGYDFKILDCQLLKSTKKQVLAAAKKESPSIIVSLIGFPSMKKDLELLRNIKEMIPDAIVIGIGATCKEIPEKVLLSGGVDIVVRSEYPYLSSLTDLIESLSKKCAFKSILGISYCEDGRVISTDNAPETDLSKIDPPCYDQFHPSDYHVSFTDLRGKKYEYVPILGSTGCQYQCFYCPYPVGCGKRVTFRSPKAIVDEIEFLHSAYGIRGFFFRDQSFTTSKNHAIGVCNEIELRKLDVGWFCEARVNEVSKEILHAMKRAGCKRIHYGVETGDPNLIHKCKKGADLHTIRRAFQLTKEAGIWRTANVIIGWPEDTADTLKHTYDFVLGLEPDDVNWNTLVPYPGTEYYEIALRESLIVSKDLDEFTPDNCVVRTLHLDSRQVCEAKKRMIRGFSSFQMRKALVDMAFGRRKIFSVGGVRDFLRKYVSQSG